MTSDSNRNNFPKKRVSALALSLIACQARSPGSHTRVSARVGFDAQASSHTAVSFEHSTQVPDAGGHDVQDGETTSRLATPESLCPYETNHSLGGPATDSEQLAERLSRLVPFEGSISTSLVPESYDGAKIEDPYVYLRQHTDDQASLAQWDIHDLCKKPRLIGRPIQGLAWMTRIAVDAQTVAVQADEQQLTAYSATSGQMLWTRSLGTDPQFVLKDIVDGVVITQNPLKGFRGGDGALLWELDPASHGFPGELRSIHINKSLPGPIFEYGNDEFSIRPNDGTIIWAASVPRNCASGWYTTNREVFHCYSSVHVRSLLRILNLENGHWISDPAALQRSDKCDRLIAQGKNLTWCSYSKALPRGSRGTLKYGDSRESLVAHDTQSWRIVSETPLSRYSARDGGRVIIAHTRMGTVQILDKDTGAMLWSWAGIPNTEGVLFESVTGQLVVPTQSRCFVVGKKPVVPTTEHYHGTVRFTDEHAAVHVRVCRGDQCAVTDAYGNYDLTCHNRGTPSWTMIWEDFPSMGNLMVDDIQDESDPSLVDFSVAEYERLPD